MSSDRYDAPLPDLRIVFTDSLHPHEEHDSQRSAPLAERLSHETIVINPPIVSPMGASQYLILDGANRFHAFSHLGYPHILVQVASYDGGYVELKTWRHIVCEWDIQLFLERLRATEGIRLTEGQQKEAIAHLMMKDQSIIAVMASVENTHERNAALRQIVSIYQQNAVLQRTALSEPDDIWMMHPTGIAIVEFPHYQPADIIAAARYNAYLPPGISRHIIHGRALRVNYPLEILRNRTASLASKNEQLQEWIKQKLNNRQIRYYAEASYQFDE